MRIKKIKERDKMNAFGFEFTVQNDNSEDAKFVTAIVPFLSEPEYDEDDRSNMDDRIIDICGELNLESEYGVHDVSGGQIVEVDGKEYEFIFGFDTYEVPNEKISELMIIWRNIFNKLGFTVGDIIYLEED